MPRRDWRPESAIAAVTLLVYLDALRDGFVWDDLYLVVDNPLVKTWQGVWRAFAVPLLPGPEATSYYRPLQTVTYVIDYHLWGRAVAGFHLTNVLLHAAAAILLYRLALALLRAPRAALIAGLLLAVHPLATEAVTYVAGRSDPLAAVAMLAALLAWERGASLVAVSAFFVALLAREASMVVILLAVVVDAAIAWRDGTPVARRLRARAITGYIPLLAILVAYLLLRSTVIGTTVVPAATAATAIVPLGWRLVTMLGVVGRYLGLLVAPIGLHMERTVFAARTLLDPAVLAGALVVGALLALAVRGPWPVRFGIAWFFVALLPVAGFVPLATFMAEHWLYVPSMGLFIVAGWAVDRLVPARAAWPAVAVALACYGALTARRNLDWHDPLTLFESTVRLAPASPRVYANLGEAYQEAGRRDEARAAYTRALALGPPPAEAAHVHNNLGNLARQDGRSDDAIREYDEALRLDPRHVAARNGLALALRAAGRDAEARVALEAAVALDPDSAVTHSNLGNVFFRAGDLSRAEAEYRRAVELNPDFADAHNNLGSVYFREGNRALAVREYETALHLDPGSTDIQRNLGIARSRH